MKLPRDISGRELVRALRCLGYVPVRQVGSHIRIETQMDGVHREVVPDHNPVRIGTFHSILKSVATHHKMTVDELLTRLDL